MAMKKSNKVTCAIAVLLTAAILCMILTQGFTEFNPYCWFGHDYENGVCIRCDAKEPVEEEEQDAEANAGGMVIGNDNVAGNGIMLLSTDIPRALYGDYGISPLAESAKQLTAEVEPANAENQLIDWHIEWDNANSEWAKGKTVTDYVTVTPISDGALTANVTCLQAFGEQILITASSRENSDIVSDPCTVNYVKRITGIDLQLSSDTVAFDAVYTVDATPQYGVGTLEGEYSVNGYSIYLVSEIATALNGLQATSKAGMTTYTATYSCSSSVGAILKVDVMAQTFSFSGSDAFSVFGSYKTEEIGVTGPASDVSPAAAPGSMSAAISTLTSSVNNTFKNKITSITGPHMTFKFDYTYTYNGDSYVETTATAGLKFDADTLAMRVVSVSLPDSIVF